MIPTLGYFKDQNTNEVVIVEQHAQIVRQIFNLYTSGYGLKLIAKMLNADGIKSPGYYQKHLLGKSSATISLKLQTVFYGKTQELSGYYKMNFILAWYSAISRTQAK